MTERSPVNKVMWSEIKYNQVFVYFAGELVYKRWINEDGSKKQASIIFNKEWPIEWIK